MIKIPQFTFFCGPNTQRKHDLIAPFVEKVVPAALLNQIYSPVEEAAATLFFNNPLEESFDKPPPGLRGPSVQQFIGLTADHLRIHYGIEALGLIALESYRREGWEEIFAHTIYTDIDYRQDTLPFVRTYGTENCLFIETGPLSTLPPLWLGSKVIWLATPTVESQLAQLLRELTPIRTDEASHGPTPIVNTPDSETPSPH